MSDTVSDLSRREKALAAARTTRSSIQSGDMKTVLKNIRERFPRVLARLAKDD